MGSFNVGGLKSRSIKIAKILETVKNINITVLQETHFSNEKETKFFNQVFESHFQIFHSFAAQRCTGVTFLINRNFMMDKLEKVFEIKGRCLAFKLTISSQIIVIVGIYAPAAANIRHSFFANLHEKSIFLQAFQILLFWMTLIVLRTLL